MPGPHTKAQGTGSAAQTHHPLCIFWKSTEAPWGEQGARGSPVQEGPVGLLDHVFLSLANLVPLLCVGNSPGLLDLAQFFKAIIEALATKRVEREVTQTQVFRSLLLQP